MRFILAALFSLLVGSAYAQVADKDHVWSTPGNTLLGGAVQLCPNAAGLAVPCTNGTGAAGFPAGATPITASSTGTTGVVTATLAAVAGKTTYICGFSIASTATAGINGNATVAGTITGTLNYTQAVGVAPAVATLSQTFTPCVPASAVNTAITINSIAAGTAGVTSVSANGYQY